MPQTPSIKGWTQDLGLQHYLEEAEKVREAFALVVNSGYFRYVLQAELTDKERDKIREFLLPFNYTLEHALVVVHSLREKIAPPAEETNETNDEILRNKLLSLEKKG